MYFLALVTMFVFLILSFIEVTFQENGFVVFFGIITVLLLCVGCVLLHRILYEICMSFLQIPKLLTIMSRVEQALANNNNNNISNTNITSGGISGINGNTADINVTKGGDSNGFQAIN